MIKEILSAEEPNIEYRRLENALNRRLAWLLDLTSDKEDSLCL